MKAGRPGTGKRTGDGRPGPAALGVEALLEAQRRGLAAAGDLVDRLVLAVDGRPDDGAATDRHGGEGMNGASPGSGAAGSADDLVRFWIEVVQRGLDAFAPVGAAAADGAGVDATTLDLAGRAATGTVRLVVGSDRAEIWVRNGGDRVHEDVELRCGDLRSPEGAVLPETAVTFDPPRLTLPPRSSRGVVVSADASTAPGTYRGVIQCAAAPGAWVPVEVVVPGRTGV